MTIYDEYYDCMICPANEILRYSTINREGYRKYKSDPEKCSECLFKEKCTESKTNQKVVMRHICEKYNELVEDYRHTPKYSDIYKLRKETIERVFADAKKKHEMRYTQYRGLAKVKAEATLRFACMNLKKLAKRNRIKGLFGPFICGFIQILAQVIQKSVANPMLQPILSTVRAPSPRELST